MSRIQSYLAGEPRPVPAALIDRVDQEPIEHGEHQQRHTDERDDAKPVVRFLVDVVPAQFRAALLELSGGRVDGYVPLVRRGGRARDAEQGHDQDDALGPGFGAQHAAAQRMAHGYVPLDGERHGQQHRRVACKQVRREYYNRDDVLRMIRHDHDTISAARGVAIVFPSYAYIYMV